MQGDLARQYDRPRGRRQQQSAVQQPAQPGRRIRRDLAVRRPPHQALQDLAGLGGGVGEQRRHPRPVREQAGQGGHRGDRVMGRGQSGGRDDLLDAPRRHPGRGLLHGGPEPRRRRVLRRGRQQLTGRADQPQPVVTAPDQGLLAQDVQGVRQGGGDGRVARVPGHEPEQFLVRRRVRRHGQRLRRLQREPVQPLQGAHDRGTGAGAGRELGEVGGHGRDEIRSAAQQRAQRGVAPGAERFREGAGGRRRVLGAHPANGSGSPPAGEPTVYDGLLAALSVLAVPSSDGLPKAPAPEGTSWGSRATRSFTSI